MAIDPSSHLETRLSRVEKEVDELKTSVLQTQDEISNLFSKFSELENTLHSHIKERRIVLVVQAIAILLLLAMQLVTMTAVVKGETPQEILDVVMEDLQNTPSDARENFRYLSMAHVPEDQHDDLARAVSFVLNSTSRSTVISRPGVIHGTKIIRIDLSRYAPDPKDFSSYSSNWFAVASKDRYWHILTEKQDEDGNVKTFLAEGPWLREGALRELREMSGAKGVLMRADQWLVVASSTEPIGYYYFLAGIPKTEKQFLAQFNVSFERDFDFLILRGASLIESQVTFKPRRLYRAQSVFGGIYITRDMEVPKAETDPLRHPIDDDLTFEISHDASEIIAVGRNGLFRYALYDGDGERVDTVPDVIAKDSTDPHGTGILYPMISCVRCHVENGLRPFQDDFSALVNQPDRAFVQLNPQGLERVRFFYDQAALASDIAVDRKIYDDATMQAAAVNFAEMSQILAEQYNKFLNQVVTLERASAEVGVAPDEFRAGLQKSTDPIILTLVDGRSVLREQWEDSFPEAATVLAAPPPVADAPEPEQ